jgi:hypothetical protein
MDGFESKGLDTADFGDDASLTAGLRTFDAFRE